MIKKGTTFAWDPRGCDVARKATRQRHAGPHSAYKEYTYTYILHITYSKGIQPSIYRKPIQHTNPSGVKADVFHSIFPCGTKSHTDIFISSDVADGGALDRRRIGNPRVDRVDTQTIDP